MVHGENAQFYQILILQKLQNKFVNKLKKLYKMDYIKNV